MGDTPLDSGDRSYSALAIAYNQAVENIKRGTTALQKAKDDLKALADDAETERREELEKTVERTRDELNGAYNQAERLDNELQSAETLEKARQRFKKIEAGGRPGSLIVKEPDIYERGNGLSFFHDLYMSEIKHDPISSDRVHRHHRHEIEKRAVLTGGLGGLIPPAYLIDLYAKASRNGRVFADQCNGGTLPPVGMSVVLPRITTPALAGAQATENTALATQDVAETDLSVPVRTLGGYLTVSRQAIERAAYNDEILFEDLIARYWALLDSQCISGAGSAGTILGVLATSGISTSTASTATVVGVWPKIADVIQQINVATGGLGYVADRIIMHPRRWGFFEAALDTQNRPLMTPSGPIFNTIAAPDAAAGYGYVGNMHGLQVYTDANIPTLLGAGTNEDRIIVMASSVVHLFERGSDPVTVTFEQPLGTQLALQLVAYGYAAFTAGRYPAAAGVVSGAGLVPPTF